MQKKTGVTVSQAFRVHQIFLQSKQKIQRQASLISNALEKMFPMQTKAAMTDSMQEHSQMLEDDAATEKLDFADKILQQGRAEKQKDEMIKAQIDQVHSLKQEQRKYKFKLKELYINLLNRPKIIIEKGLTMEDIITFLRVIGVEVSINELYEKFTNEEKWFL
jgi:hypothetical protein